MGIILDQGKSGLALMVGSIADNRPQWMAIGSGSGTEVVGISGPLAEFNTAAFTSADISTPKEVTWTADYSAPAMSGNGLVEFAMTTGSPTLEAWHYTSLGTAVDFDGSTELKIELKWTVM